MCGVKASKALAQLFKTARQCMSHVFVCMTHLCPCTSEIHDGRCVLPFLKKTFFGVFLWEIGTNHCIVNINNCVLSYLCQWLKWSGSTRWKGTQIAFWKGSGENYFLDERDSVKFHISPKITQNRSMEAGSWSETHSLRPWNCPDWQKDSTGISKETGNRILV